MGGMRAPWRKDSLLHESLISCLIAQSVEHETFNLREVGLSPMGKKIAGDWTR